MRFREWLKGRKARVPDDAPEIPVETEDESEVDPFNPFPEPVRLEILDVFDLHTIAAAARSALGESISKPRA